jgi:type IV secretion system protein VirD4
MRPDRNSYPEHNPVMDTFLLWIGGLLFAGCGLVWLVGQVAAIVFGVHQHLPVRLVDMVGVLLRLPETWEDPAKAWPPASQQLLPGPVGMYAAAILTIWLPVMTVGLVMRLLSPRARRQRKQRGARWASLWQLRHLLVLGPRRGRIILGRRDRIRDRLLEGC